MAACSVALFKWPFIAFLIKFESAFIWMVGGQEIFIVSPFAGVKQGTWISLCTFLAKNSILKYKA